jgi:hypothetical protein
MVMEALKCNAELDELNSFSRKLDPEENLKDRLIIKHLRRRKNNFLFDFDEPSNTKRQYGVSHE